MSGKVGVIGKSAVSKEAVGPNLACAEACVETRSDAKCSSTTLFLSL